LNQNNNNRNNKGENSGGGWKMLIPIIVVSLIMTIVVNSIYTSVSKSYLEEIPFDKFISMMENDEIDTIELKTDRILILTKENAELPSTKQMVYYTGLLPQNDMTEIYAKLQEKGVDYQGTVIEEVSPLMNFLISWILPYAIFLLALVFLMRFLSKRMGSGGGMMGGMGQSRAKVYMEKETGVTFEDVAGQDEAKEQLMEIIDFLHSPQKYAAIGAKLPKGALLVGSPGTGKTLLAKAVAGEAKVPFFSIAGSDFVEMFVGVGASRVRDLFQTAAKQAPAIIFIDEIDAIGKSRDNRLGGNDEREQTLNQLLTEMDGFDGKKGVVILAATNRPESLDPALLRPGRFDRRIPVELPDVGGREAILRVHSKGIRMADNIDLKAIARATSGASGAELANIINEAALRAVRLGRDTVTQDDLMESVETVIAGYQRKNAVMSESEKKIVSYHEIGHALVAALQTDSAPVTKITIIPRTSGALGYTMQVDEDEHYLMSREELYNKIVTLTGGQAAEQLVFHSITTGASNDIEKATRLARGMITRYGMGGFGMVALETQNSQYLGQDTSLTCSPAFAEKIDEQVVALVEEARKKADSILREHEDKLHELAAYLLNKETITGEEFMSILKAEDQKP
jgi:cell division protease FtsH